MSLTHYTLILVAVSQRRCSFTRARARITSAELNANDLIEKMSTGPSASQLKRALISMLFIDNVYSYRAYSQKWNFQTHGWRELVSTHVCSMCVLYGQIKPIHSSNFFDTWKKKTERAKQIHRVNDKKAKLYYIWFDRVLQ